jgi:hypothetical protein
MSGYKFQARKTLIFLNLQIASKTLLYLLRFNWQACNKI